MAADNLINHWGRVTHICVSKLAIIGSDDGLSTGRRQAIIWTNAGILFNAPLGTNFSEILIAILTFSFKKMRLNVSSAKWPPFCLGLIVLQILTQTMSIRMKGVICWALIIMLQILPYLLGAGPWFNIKMLSTCIGNPIVEIRRSYDRLISKMGFPMLVRWHLYIESGPRTLAFIEGWRLFQYKDFFIAEFLS